MRKYPVVMNLFRPLGLEDEADGEPHEEVTQRRGVEHAGIENGDGQGKRTCLRFVVESQRLVLCGQLGHCGEAGLALALPVGIQIVIAYPPMGAYPMEGDLPGIEQGDEVGTGNPQESRCLPCGQFTARGHERDAVPFRELLEQACDEGQRLGGERKLGSYPGFVGDFQRRGVRVSAGDLAQCLAGDARRSAFLFGEIAGTMSASASSSVNG